MADRVDILTGTLGQGARRGQRRLHRGREEIVDLLRQRSRPYLFSNSLAPAIAAASIAVFDLLDSSDELRQRLRDNTAFFRQRLEDEGFDVLPGEHPIIPVMFGDAGPRGPDGRGAAATSACT